MIYNRKFENEINKWYKENSDNSLIIYGARQVGKTTSTLNWISQNNLEYIYINFMNQLNIIDQIIKCTSYEEIVSLLCLLNKKDKNKLDIIFLDEIQVNEDLIYLTRLFKNKKIKLICSGSLLGIKLSKKSIKTDVGSKQYLQVYPLDFEEFLIWTNNEQYLEEIKNKFDSFQQIHPLIHEKILDIYYKYLIVGGMPEVVSEYIKNNYEITNSIYNKKQSILNDYINDNNNSLYCEDSFRITTIKTMNMIYDKIDQFLIQPNNKRFIIDSINKSFRYKNITVSLDVLKSSNILYICNNVDAIKFPLNHHIKETFFKLYYSDIGLLTQKLNLNESMLYEWKTNNNSDIWGGVIENSVICNLHQEKYFYFSTSSNNNTKEIDLLLEDKNNGEIIPMEIKSKLGNFSKAESIKKYIKEYDPSKIYLISPNNFNNMLHFY